MHEIYFTLENLTTTHMITMLSALETCNDNKNGRERQELVCAIRTELSMANVFIK